MSLYWILLIVKAFFNIGRRKKEEELERIEAEKRASEVSKIYKQRAEEEALKNKKW